MRKQMICGLYMWSAVNSNKNFDIVSEKEADTRECVLQCKWEIRDESGRGQQTYIFI